MSVPLVTIISKSRKGCIRPQNEEEKLKRSATITNWWAEPGRREKQSEAAKEAWKKRRIKSLKVG
jgi:hypothetical protein